MDIYTTFTGPKYQATMLKLMLRLRVLFPIRTILFIPIVITLYFLASRLIDCWVPVVPDEDGGDQSSIAQTNRPEINQSQIEG
jgi:hypothetical protein